MIIGRAARTRCRKPLRNPLVPLMSLPAASWPTTACPGKSAI